jgi:hypothetical protein
MRHRWAVAAVLVLASALPAVGQGSEAKVRALNLARNWAVHANGGLTVYRPADCMFKTSAGGGPCLLRATGAGFRFRFLGGPPGWELPGGQATVETDIEIAPDGRRVLSVPYNGRPR